MACSEFLTSNGVLSARKKNESEKSAAEQKLPQTTKKRAFSSTDGQFQKVRQ